MNYNDYCVFDFETCGSDTKNTSIVQIGAAIINKKSLEIIDKINLNMKPLPESPIEEGALKVIKKTKEELEDYPDPKKTFPVFVDWVNKYNKTKGTNPSSFNAPIPCGYNIIGFDIPILNRYCEKFKIGWDAKRESQKIFNQVNKIDLMDHLFFWFENLKEPKNLKLDTMREFMGFDIDSIKNAHDALQDVEDTAKIIIRLLKAQRYLTEYSESLGKRRLEMKGCMING